MTDTAERLEEETDKWRGKLQQRISEVEAVDGDGTVILENARAYLEDADHFEADGDMVRAFEAVVWGWSWVEIGEELGKIGEK